MIRKRAVRVNSILIISFVFLIISCKNETKSIVEYNDFDFQKLEPISKQNTHSNWYLKGTYTNDSLKTLIFLNKKDDSILKKDSIFYVNDFKYFVDDSEIKINENYFHLIKITFINDNKIRKHILFRKEKKYYLLAIEKQINSFEFEVKRINTNSYCLEFKSVNEYLQNIKVTENKSFYFTDFISYKLFYKKDKFFYKEMMHFDWGNADSPSYLNMPNAYGNLYLDLDNFKKPYYFLDSSSLKCLK